MPAPLTQVLGLMHSKSVLFLLLGLSTMKATAAGWDDPLDPVAIASQAVADKRQPVLRVVHEDGPGGWQFYDDTVPLEGPVALPKEDILSIDPSLAEIKDLPVGWEAIRAAPSGKWARTRIGQ